MAETVTLALVVVSLGLLVWNDRPSTTACAWVGLLLALATLTRSGALVLIVPTLGYLLARRAGPARVALTAVTFVLPLYLYASWFGAVHGTRALTATDGFFLYGRVMTWVSCDRLDLPPEQTGLCDERPPQQRPGLEHYMWSADSPAFDLQGSRVEQNAVLRDFALSAMRQQPIGYARAVLGDLGRVLDPVRHEYPSRFTYQNYLFSATPRHLTPQVVQDVRSYQVAGDGRTRPVPILASALAAYQSLVYVPSTLYAGAAILALAGVALGRPAHPADRRRPVAGLLLAAGVVQVLLPIVIQGFDYRYLLPVLPLLSAAAALAVQLLLERSARRSA